MPSCLSANSSPILLISVLTAPPRSCPSPAQPLRDSIHDLIAIDFCAFMVSHDDDIPSPSSAMRVRLLRQHARLQRARRSRPLLR
ncbi:hypothetical protein KCP75_17400 [Salmonella enterica subsp. enterica]|nr:hypothetical protein KCP75_17400 [Salmonella enterica subsp. enterica]